MCNSRPIYLNEDTRILWVRACVFSKQYKTVHNSLHKENNDYGLSDVVGETITSDIYYL